MRSSKYVSMAILKVEQFYLIGLEQGNKVATNRLNCFFSCVSDSITWKNFEVLYFSISTLMYTLSKDAHH